MRGSICKNDSVDRFQSVENPDLLVIAGEASGDEHSAALVKQLKERNPALKVAALGGRNLHAAEAIMLEDLTAHSAVGLWEVLKRLPIFIELINKTVAWIEKNRPKMVLFVDFVGFNLEIAKRLYEKKISQKGGGNVKTYFYISPQIWAWKAKRRFNIAKWIDSLGTIFPFEPEHYKDTTLNVEFVGHPFVSPHFKNPFSYDSNGPIVLLPGSRGAIVKKHMPLLWAAYKKYAEKNPTAKVAACYASEPMRKLMIELTSNTALPPTQTREAEDKKEPKQPAGDNTNIQKLTLYPAGTPMKASAVLCTAGTISLTCALAGIPSAIIYKTDRLTFAYGKLVYKLPYLGMPNILLKRTFIREYLQEDVNPETLLKEIAILKNSFDSAKLANEGAEELKAMLSHPTQRNAVEWVESGLR